MEIWKDIKGYPGYQISNLGRVWSVKSQRCLKPYNSNGYLKIDLFAANGKRKKEYIHRLVAIAFIDNPDGLPQVNHISGNKQNNCVENLEWVDRSKNMYHSYHDLGNTKGCFTGKTVLCVETNIIYNSLREAADAVGLASISGIKGCCDKTYGYKTAKGYHWEWVNG